MVIENLLFQIYFRPPKAGRSKTVRFQGIGNLPASSR